MQVTVSCDEVCRVHTMAMSCQSLSVEGFFLLSRPPHPTRAEGLSPKPRNPKLIQMGDSLLLQTSRNSSQHEAAGGPQPLFGFRVYGSMAVETLLFRQTCCLGIAVWRRIPVRIL